MIFGLLYAQDRNAVVIDHTSYAVSETEGDHTLIASEEFIKSKAFFGGKEIEVLFLLRVSGLDMYDRINMMHLYCVVHLSPGVIDSVTRV